MCRVTIHGEEVDKQCGVQPMRRAKLLSSWLISKHAQSNFKYIKATHLKSPLSHLLNSPLNSKFQPPNPMFHKQQLTPGTESRFNACTSRALHYSPTAHAGSNPHQEGDSITHHPKQEFPTSECRSKSPFSSHSLPLTRKSHSHRTAQTPTVSDGRSHPRFPARHQEHMHVPRQTPRSQSGSSAAGENAARWCCRSAQVTAGEWRWRCRVR